MIAAIELEKPAACFFLGDGERDIDEVREQFPGLTVYAVRGNCDMFSTLPQQLRFAFGGLEIFAAHGHMHGVKRDPAFSSLKAEARKTGAKVILFGHTHKALLRREDGLTLMNPGPAGGQNPGYGVLRTENGRLHCELCRIADQDQLDRTARKE